MILSNKATEKRPCCPYIKEWQGVVRLVKVLHAFQKKSKSGIKTPKADLNMIEKRLKQLKIILKKGRFIEKRQGKVWFYIY